MSEELVRIRKEAVMAGHLWNMALDSCVCANPFGHVSETTVSCLGRKPFDGFEALVVFKLHKCQHRNSNILAPRILVYQHKWTDCPN